MLNYWRQGIGEVWEASIGVSTVHNYYIRIIQHDLLFSCYVVLINRMQHMSELQYFLYNSQILMLGSFVNERYDRSYIISFIENGKTLHIELLKARRNWALQTTAKNPWKAYNYALLWYARISKSMRFHRDISVWVSSCSAIKSTQLDSRLVSTFTAVHLCSI